jgi:hypothetical protein
MNGSALGGEAAGDDGVDLLGFPLPQLTSQQNADRLASSKQTEAFNKQWHVFASRKALPSRGELKALVRKVRRAVCELLLQLLLLLAAHLTQQRGTALSYGPLHAMLPPCNRAASRTACGAGCGAS